ncbi:MAG: XRE family transcriptional regulator [Vicinamibacterales bacterium]
MKSPVLEERLRDYGIGESLRKLRQRKKLGLVELGRHSGLSAAMLSKIERGRLFPTLPTLMRVAMVFGVGLEYFFTARKSAVAVVKRAERLSLPDDPDATDVSYFFQCLDYPAVERKLNAYLATFEPREGKNIRPHAHAGAEFIYVTSGRLRLSVDGNDYDLDAGDSVYFDSSHDHGYRGADTEPTQAVVVVVS